MLNMLFLFKHCQKKIKTLQETHLFDILLTKTIYEISPNIIFDFFVSIHPFAKDHVQKQTFIQDLAMYFISKSCLSVHSIEHITIKIRVVVMFMHFILFFILHK
jgi:hypothetical protein